MQRTAEVVSTPLVHDRHGPSAAGPQAVHHRLHVLLMHHQIVRIGDQ